jgi:hypothetical protein
MSEYTPTTKRVREVYALFDEDEDEFSRWLAGVKAQAWDEGAMYAAVECNAIEDESEPWIATGENPYREVVK